MDDSGQYKLSDYELQRLERIKKNEAFLERLGLGNVKQNLKSMTKKTKRNARRQQQTKQQAKRRSTRSRKTTKLLMLSYANEDDTKCVRQEETNYKEKSPSSEEEEEEDTFAVSSRPFRGRRYCVDEKEWELSKDEKEVLQKNVDENYLAKFKVRNHDTLFCILVACCFFE